MICRTVTVFMPFPPGAKYEQQCEAISFNSQMHSSANRGVNRKLKKGKTADFSLLNST
jgi:hypothetical protein